MDGPPTSQRALVLLSFSFSCRSVGAAVPWGPRSVLLSFSFSVVLVLVLVVVLVLVSFQILVLVLVLVLVPSRSRSRSRSRSCSRSRSRSVVLRLDSFTCTIVPVPCRSPHLAGGRGEHEIVENCANDILSIDTVAYMLFAPMLYAKDFSCLTLTPTSLYATANLIVAALIDDVG